MGDKPDYEHGEPKPISTSGASMHDLVISDIAERKDFGLKKYDSLLQAYNGRNFLQDLYEELQDAIVYTRGALEEQERAADFFRYLLIGFVRMHDKLYPELVGKVIIRTEGNIPGWLLAVNKEVLGDRFEHKPL